MANDAPDYQRPYAFFSQAKGVSDATQQAAEDDNAFFVERQANISGGVSVSEPGLETDFGTPGVLETFHMFSVDSFVEDTRVELRIDVNGDGTDEFRPTITPRTGVLRFEPGVFIDSQGELDAEIYNDGSTASKVGFVLQTR